MIRPKRSLLWVLLWAALLPCLAYADATVVVDNGETSVRIGVVPFAGDGVPLDVAAVVSEDLRHTGRFEPLPANQLPQQPSVATAIDFAQWRLVRADYLAIGRIRSSAGGYTVEVELFNPLSGERLVGVAMDSTATGLRLTAHRIADLIYEKIIGVPGVAATRIAYVSVEGPIATRRWKLVVADADGFNPVVIVDSKEPLMSPVWSPDGQRLAYVSFEGRVSSVFVQSIVTGNRERVSARAGINGAPAWSPDGRKLALALSQPDGNVDVFVLDLESRNLLRVTDDPAIDTEPCFSADGNSLYFTSDRAGRPQIYQIRLAPGERARRLTFENPYNARPRISPDGKWLAVVTQVQGAYRIARVDPTSGQSYVLSNGHLDESPAFAPNSEVIVYSSRDRGRGILSTVAVDSNAVTHIISNSSDLRDPAWSPKL